MKGQGTMDGMDISFPCPCTCCTGVLSLSLILSLMFSLTQAPAASESERSYQTEQICFCRSPCFFSPMLPQPIQRRQHCLYCHSSLPLSLPFLQTDRQSKDTGIACKRYQRRETQGVRGRERTTGSTTRFARREGRKQAKERERATNAEIDIFHLSSLSSPSLVPLFLSSLLLCSLLHPPSMPPASPPTLTCFLLLRPPPSPRLLHDHRSFDTCFPALVSPGFSLVLASAVADAAAVAVARNAPQAASSRHTCTGTRCDASHFLPLSSLLASIASLLSVCVIVTFLISY